jgi:hypothetical protein
VRSPKAERPAHRGGDGGPQRLSLLGRRLGSQLTTPAPEPQRRRDPASAPADLVIATILEHSHRELRVLVRGAGAKCKIALELWTRADETGRMEPRAVLSVRREQIDSLIRDLLDARASLIGEASNG